KIRGLRKRAQLTQAQLAQALGISGSYLNLIENNRRPLTANMLLKLAKYFELDLGSFANTEDARLMGELREAFSDPLFGHNRPASEELQELVAAAPQLAQAVLKLYANYRSATASATTLSEQLSTEAGGAIVASNPTEEVNDLLQQHDNFFETIERAAEELWVQAELCPEDVYGRLSRYLATKHDIEVVIAQAAQHQAMRRYDPARRVITISELLPPRTRRFQLAHQVGLILYREVLDGVKPKRAFSSPAARALWRVVLANYFAAAVLMPYGPFLRAAEDHRYDFELLAHRYRCSFEQICHRLTTLRRRGQEGIPLHFIRIDIAGNISKRFSASGIRMPRFSGACPRWNVHAAFLTPGMFRTQLSRMPDGHLYFCIARTIRRETGGYHRPHTVHSIGIGCEVSHAHRLVYADGFDLSNRAAAIPVGVTCRTCDQGDCQQRVFPAMQHPLSIDENVRGMSFYASVDKPQ
ncbi:MAG TPA: XRE family transcriptional regulator, partial [Sorangium sp.]|nr:XRE family transcriptional regulator [Sorangium sp.]